MHDRRHTPALSSGFTLLELILSLLLMGTMMGAAWTMMGNFSDRLETSQRRMERSQLVRSLQQTLEHDLRGCVIIARTEERNEASPLDVTNPTDDQSPLAVGLNSGTPLEPNDYSETNSLDPTVASDALITDDRTVPADWLSPDTFLLGASHMLIFDCVTPADPEPDEPLIVEPTVESADLPDVTRRIVYAFVDPLTAARTGQPSGLIRCQLKSRQLAILRSLSAGNVNFLDIIRPALAEIELDPSANSAVELPPDRVSLSIGPSGGEPAFEPDATTDGFAARPEEALQLANHLDYIPEVRSLLFRFYDGETWQTSWDTRGQRGLPLAIELRFQLVAEHSPKTPQAEVNEFDFNSPSPPPSITERLPPIDAFEPMDDRIRSAQTRPPEDHRYLIFLGVMKVAEPRQSSGG